ncbi:MAG: hypothetical protein KDA59_09985 [Planctomycetales bacterium]|nr:hypothetical protein [Planctomycetales bacterium]
MRFVRILACFTFFAIAGCGKDFNDPNRVPEGAADTSDPSAVNMGQVQPGAPKSATPGPPGN